MRKAQAVRLVGGILFGAMGCAAAGNSTANAQDAEAFYKSHTLTLGVS